MASVDRLLQRWRQLPSWVADAAVAAAVAVVTVTSIVVGDDDDPSEHMTALAWGLQGLQVVPLLWRRRAPVVVLAVVSVAAFAFGMAALPDPAIPFGLGVAVYSVGAYRARPVSVPCAAAIVVAAALVLAFDRQADAADVAVNYFVGVTSWLVGDTVRTQRERAAWLLERRDDEARRAVADERLRISRDLHDVVAHHISVIAVQAEAAQEVLAADPQRAGEAMATVADTARTALGELRRALGVLRSDATLVPQPGLAALEDLATSIGQAGLAVDLRTTGEARVVDGVVGVTAYRVVQEALTNVLRHADARHAAVDVAFGAGSLVVTVDDDGRGPLVDGAAPGGHGLVGMRERLAMLGGDLATGPAPGGGFRVRARLPLPVGSTGP
jgi:signal transduction histidine kinase